MQTILGANGVIGHYTAKALKTYTDQIRLVSRNPRLVHASDQLFSADLTRLEDTRQAVKGSQDDLGDRLLALRGQSEDGQQREREGGEGWGSHGVKRKRGVKRP